MHRCLGAKPDHLFLGQGRQLVNLLLGEIQANSFVNLHDSEEWNRYLLLTEQVSLVKHEVRDTAGGEVDDETTDAANVAILRVDW